MSGEGNPNHDPSTGQFSSGGGSSGPKSKVGKTPRKLRTAKRSTQPSAPTKGGVHATMNDAAVKTLMAQPPIHGKEAAHNAMRATGVTPAPDLEAYAAGRKAKANPRPMNDPGPAVAKAFAPPPKPASPSADDLQKLINPGYGAKTYAPIPGGLKDPKPIDPAHVPGGRAKRTAARNAPGTGRDQQLAAQASAHSAATAAVEKIMKGIDMPTHVQNSDRLDFQEQHVTTIRDSLVSAYQAGGGTHAPVHGEGVIAKIAKKHLDIDSFAVKNSDREDFQEVGVAGMKKALTEAYQAGAADKAAGGSQTRREPSPKYASPKYLAQMANASDARNASGEDPKPVGAAGKQTGNKTFVMPHPDGSGDLIRIKAANIQDASKLHAAHLGDRTTANKLKPKPTSSGRAARTVARSKDPFAPDKHAQATSARLAQGISKKTPTMNVLNPERAAGGGGDVEDTERMPTPKPGQRR